MIVGMRLDDDGNETEEEETAINNNLSLKFNRMS